METYRIKTGDTHPPLVVRLTESCKETDEFAYPDGFGGWIRKVDLALAVSIRVILRRTEDGIIIENPAVNAAVVDGPGDPDPDRGNAPVNRGLVRMLWDVPDTHEDNAGDYLGETEVTWSLGPPPRIETFPADPDLNFPLIIGLDLD